MLLDIKQDADEDDDKNPETEWIGEQCDTIAQSLND